MMRMQRQGEECIGGLFTFGCIADTQYADIDNGTNFDGSRVRYFRNGLRVAREAVEAWRSLRTPFAFIANLGDVIDGRNAALGTSRTALASLFSALGPQSTSDFSSFTINLVGNHELYNFARKELEEGIDGFTTSSPPQCTNAEPRGTSYFTFPVQAAPSYRIVVLDTYAVSTLRLGKGSPWDPDAVALCKSHNPNDITAQTDFFVGLTGLDRRWVPSNGALGEEQLTWLRTLLHHSAEKGEKVIMLSHVITHPFATPRQTSRTLLWDYDALLAILKQYNGVVRLALCGHAHGEGYHYDEESGTHHVALSSPLERGDEQPGNDQPQQEATSVPLGGKLDNYCTVTVLSDGGIEIVGHGSILSRSLPPPAVSKI